MVVLMNLIGIIGATTVTASNVPQVLLFIKQKHAEGISVSGIWLGLVGIIFRAIFLVYTVGFNIIIILPYVFSITCCIMTLYYCYYPTYIDEKDKE